ncbi:helix-turn-helix domain-containing protein [Mycobacterium marinum]|uniref:helix-turn-helix domain-containing protein n=1 Tax=Mycobacterium marinum TaxID=1781 RepID=UPI002358F65E|nr:hypothetical protein [Mycobacterium marinum]MDC8973997.1 hypothetical protein [Mycobacterium marinum]
MAANLKAKDHYTVSEVAELSRKSPSTVTRAVEKGLMEPIPGPSNTLRLTADSVHEYVRSLLDKAPRLPDGVPRHGAPEPDDPSESDRGVAEAAFRRRIDELEREARAKESKIRDLEEENERLRNTTLVLRQNYAALSDDHGAYTSPKVPNN